MIKTLVPLLFLFSCAVRAAEPPQAAPAPKPAPAAPGPVQGSAPAPAPEVSLVDMLKALNRFLTEEEVQMVYDYLWESSIAALKGEPDEVTLPPELAFKLAILQKRIVKEGGYYLEGLARKMEQDLKRWHEEMLTPPPPPAYQLPQERGTPPQEPGAAQPRQP